MTQVFDRICEVKVANKEVTGLRVRFTMSASLDPEPNSSEIVITNLAPETRGAVHKKGALCELIAGYRENKSLLFLGDIRFAESTRQGADWETRIQLGDGANFYKFSRGSFAFEPGTTTRDAIESLVGSSSGLKGRGNIAEFLQNLPAHMQALTSGFSSVGNNQQALEKLAKSAGYNMSVQNGELMFRPLSPKASDFSSLGELLTPDSGLIGSPQHSTSDRKGRTAPVVKLRCLLNPRVKCGGPVRIKSETVDGNYYVTKLDHKGDTHGGDWYTDLEVKPL